MICSCELLSDVSAEEAVLSTMLGGTFKVSSLPVEAFTSPLRQEVYRLIRAGVPYESLDAELRKLGIEEDGYLADLYLTPCLGQKPLVEAIEDLKRLALLRPLCEAVGDWLKRAPHMPYQKAVLDLGRVIRSAGSHASGQKSSSEPSPK